MYVKLAHYITTYPRRTIMLVLLLAAVFMVGLKNTKFVSDFDSSLPNRSPLTKQIRDNQIRFGSRNTIVFLVSGAAAADRVNAACALSAGLQRLPSIVTGRVYGVGSDSLKYVQSDDVAVNVTGLSNVCQSGTGLTNDVMTGLGPQRALVVAPRGDLIITADIDAVSGAFGPLFEQIDALTLPLKKNGVEIAYSGQPAFLAQNDIFSKRIAYFFPLIMLLVLVLHWEALRSVQAVVVPIFTGLFATLLGLGAYGWLGLTLDTYTVLAPILILAVGAGHSVQLLKRYMEEARVRTAIGQQASEAENKAAIIATMSAMGPVLTIAVFGAAACLFALLLLDVSALARLGLLAGIGILCALFLELTLVPAIRVLLRRPVVTKDYGDLSRWWQKGLHWLAKLALTGRASVIGAGLAIIIVLLAIGLFQVKESHSMAVYTAPDVPVQRTLATLVKAGVGPYVLDIVVDTKEPDGAFSPQINDVMTGLSNELQRDDDVRAVLSSASIIGFLKCKFASNVPCISATPESTEEAKQIWTVLNSGGRDSGMTDETGQYVRLRAFVRTDETRSAERLIAKVNRFAAANKLEITLGGSAVTAKALADGIVRVSLEKAVLLVVIVLVIGGTVFRSIKMAFLFAIPTSMTIAANFAFLGWSGITLNVATASVATIAVGVGLDYLIYLSFRIREAQEQGLSYLDAVRAGHASAGGAAVCVAMAVAVGYAVLIFSPGYLVHHWIAALVPMTMLMSLFGALFVFPFLLRIFRPSLVNRQKHTDNWDAGIANYFPKHFSGRA
ncbi:MAG: MMPL family transporter [Chakrabartia sp.]